METSASYVANAHKLCSSWFTSAKRYPNSWVIISSSQQPYQGRLRLKRPWPNRQLVKCAKGGSASVSVSGGLERGFGDDVVTEEELVGLGRLGDKCKETRGIAELLECLETEAIMGEDEGKEPTDYNRRAQIFDKSSRVFQALKESGTPVA